MNAVAKKLQKEKEAVLGRRLGSGVAETKEVLPQGVQDAVVSEILSLEDSIQRSFRFIVRDALRIGELLIQQKAKLGHGAFLPWYSKFFPGRNVRTAQKYMKLFDLSQTRKIDVTQAKSLSEAMNLLLQSEEDNLPTQEEKVVNFRKEGEVSVRLPGSIFRSWRVEQVSLEAKEREIVRNYLLSRLHSLEKQTKEYHAYLSRLA
jgi:hypothetical protein